MLSEIELKLSRREKPPVCELRLVIFLLTSWAAVLATILLSMLTPLWIGRACFTLLHVPARFFHDPYAFAFGVSVCLGIASWLRQVLQRVQVQDVWQWIDGYQSPPLRAIGCLSLFGLLWFVFAPLTIGLLFEVTLVIPSRKWVEEGIASIKPLQDWALGLVLLNLWAYVCWIGLGRHINTQRWRALIQVMTKKDFTQCHRCL